MVESDRGSNSAKEEQSGPALDLLEGFPIDAFREALIAWYEENQRDFPWRRDVAPFQLLVAEVLLAQTPAPRVAEHYPSLLDEYPSASSFANAEVAELARRLVPLGFQNQRATALIEIGRRCSTGGVPKEGTVLRELPYVGDYAAAATLCFGFGEPVAVVDANVVRIYGRVFDRPFTPQDDESWVVANELVPNTGSDAQKFNYALLDIGAQVCTDVAPLCDECPLVEHCTYGSAERRS
jgi:A/G-specific adenine glycosylase